MLESVTATFRRWRMKTHKPFGKSSPEALQITLGGLDADLCLALRDAFADVDHAEVVEGNFLDLACDAIVSPANSFGDMGGGIDKAIDDFHGGKAQAAVMAAIGDQYFGELPVGAALIVNLATRRWPFVVASPTMRTPGSVAGTINAYLSMRAALVAVLKHNATSNSPIRSIAIPGLATGVGGIAYQDASEQMRRAYDSVIGGKWRDVIHPALAPYAWGDRRVVWTKTADQNRSE